jgi:hypothetical protein
MSKLTRTNAILYAKTASDMRNRIGCAALMFGGLTVSDWETDGDPPNCFIIHAEEDSVSVVPLHGGLGGTIKVKLLGEASVGKELYFAVQGADRGFVVREDEPISGSFYICALALEGGVAGEMVEAVLFRPEAVTIV